MRITSSAFLFLLVTLAFYSPTTTAQSASAPADKLQRPKLVVGLVIDQMRYDYIYRYYDKYSDKGFKRMLREGFNCRSHHYHYANTSTGAGHASIYTGSIPAIHGIIGNSWYDRYTGESLNCVGDQEVSAVGSRSNSAGKASPKNLLVSTMTDQLRIASNFRSKSISISLKDRGAILPGGHSATGAFWFDGNTGNFITSTFYMKELPKWAVEFNERKLASKLLREGWNTLLPIEQYTESSEDDLSYEQPLPGNPRPAFPYVLAGKAGDAFGLVGGVPAGNTLTREMAVAAIKGEQLGKRGDTDFIALSFSAPDGGGHRHGPNSVEMQDFYLRLDLELGSLFSFLDEWVGKGAYTVFLSADHGVTDVPEFSATHRIPGYRMNADSLYARIRKAVVAGFGEDFVQAIETKQIYLDKERMREKGISVDDVLEVIREEILPLDGIAEVFNARKLGESTLNEYQKTLFSNELHAKRSGDLFLVFQPGWITRMPYGTTHGSPYHYDTHIPFLLFGWGVRQGETYRRTRICDIAPTISALLQLLPPGGNVGEVVTEALTGHQ